MHSLSDEHVLMKHLFQVFPSFDHHRLFPYVDGEQAESVCPAGFRPSRFYQVPYSSAHLKYKLASIFLAVLMVYLIIASVLCGIAAASQTGGSIVLLSIGVTYGGKVPMYGRSGRTFR